MNSSIRRDLVVAIAVAGAVLLWVVARQGWPWPWGRSLGTLDWLAYWSTPRALLDGRGFYDIAWMTELQTELGFRPYTQGGRTFTVHPVWGAPPFSLPLLPFGGLGFSAAAAVWITGSTALYSLATLRLGRAFDGGWREWLLPVVLFAVTFIAALSVGQVVLFLTACMIFAWLALRRGEPLAVAALALPLLIKPHLFSPALVLLLASRWPGVTRARWLFAALALALVVLATLLDPAWVAGWRAQGLPTAVQTVALADLAARFLRLPEWGQLLLWPLGLLVALWRFSTRAPDDPRALAEAVWIGILASPFMWTQDLVILLPVVAEIAAMRSSFRFALLILPTVWALRIPLAWLAPWMAGTAAEGRLALLYVPLRYILYLALVGALWLWVRWRSRATEGHG